MAKALNAGVCIYIYIYIYMHNLRKLKHYAIFIIVMFSESEGI